MLKKMMEQAAAKMLQNALDQMESCVEPSCFGDPLAERVRLGEIHALQIVAEQLKGDSSSYASYELNLVLKDASRVNVVDHGSKEKIREDAAALAAFLGKPLWDAAELKMLDAVMPDKTMEEIRKVWGSNPELLDEKTKEMLEKLSRRQGEGGVRESALR